MLLPVGKTSSPPNAILHRFIGTNTRKEGLPTQKKIVMEGTRDGYSSATCTSYPCAKKMRLVLVPTFLMLYMLPVNHRQ